MEIHFLTLLSPRPLSIQLFESLPRRTGTPKTMGIKAFFVTLLLLLFLQGGCAGPSVKTTPVSRDSDLTPKRVFDLDFPSAWEGTLQGLKEKGFPVVLQDKEKGIIRTDYQAGTDTQHLGRSTSSRFKYSIFFFKEAEKKTIVNLRCLYEIKDRSGMSYTNANSIFPDEVVALEKELYKTIESFLLPKEASRLTSPGTEETRPMISTPQSPASPLPMAQIPPETLKPKEPPPAPSVSTSQAPVEHAAPQPKKIPPLPSAPPKEAQLNSPPPAKEVTQIIPQAVPKARALDYEPKMFLITQKDTPLREKPSSKSKIIETLKKGRKVEMIGESGNWVKVKIWETTLGWTLKDFLRETGANDSKK